MARSRGMWFCIALLIAAAVPFLLQLQGCGGSSGGGAAGRLQVALTDRNSEDFQSVVVSIKEVRVVPAGKEESANTADFPLVGSFQTPQSYDIMQLGAGKQVLQQMIGDAVIPPGTYTQVRLVLAANQDGQDPVNYVTLASAPTSRIALKTPSGQESGLKILGNFEVKAGQLNAIMLDFDPNTAVVAKGNGGFNLKPTGIRVVQLSDPRVLESFGAVNGSLAAFSSWSSATVSVAAPGSAAVAAGTVFSNYTSGAWRGTYSAFVPGGTYRVYVKAKGFATYSSPLTLVAPQAAVTLPQAVLTPLP